MKVISYEPLKRTMKERGISSYKLEKCGFSRATYYSIMHGGNVSTNTIDRLCEILKCEVSDIIEFVKEENPEAKSRGTAPGAELEKPGI